MAIKFYILCIWGCIANQAKILKAESEPNPVMFKVPPNQHFLHHQPHNTLNTAEIAKEVLNRSVDITQAYKKYLKEGFPSQMLATKTLIEKQRRRATETNESQHKPGRRQAQTTTRIMVPYRNRLLYRAST